MIKYALALLLLTSGCTTTISGNNNTITIMTMGMATVPISALPGLP